MGWCWSGLNWGGWSGMGTGSLILNLVLFVGVLTVLGLAVAWLIRQLGQRPAAVAAGDPLEVARRRLAAGEITITEFDEIWDRLRK